MNMESIIELVQTSVEEESLLGRTALRVGEQESLRQLLHSNQLEH